MQGVREKWVTTMYYSHEEKLRWLRLPTSKMDRSEEEEFQERMIKDSVLDWFPSATDSNQKEDIWCSNLRLGGGCAFGSSLHRYGGRRTRCCIGSPWWSRVAAVHWEHTIKLILWDQVNMTSWENDFISNNFCYISFVNLFFFSGLYSNRLSAQRNSTEP